MAFERMTDDMNIISRLGDEPNDDNGLSASALKKKFDRAGMLAKEAINKLIAALGASSAAGNIGFRPTTGVNKTNVQAAIENVQSQIAGVTQGAVANGSITSEKLADGAVTVTKLAPGAIVFADVSDAVDLRYANGDDDGSIRKYTFQYAPALGIVTYQILCYIKTSGDTGVDFFHYGHYAPKDFCNAASVFIDENRSGCSADANYSRAVNSTHSAVLEMNINGALKHNFTGNAASLYISGWYFTDDIPS